MLVLDRDAETSELFLLEDEVVIIMSRELIVLGNDDHFGQPFEGRSPGPGVGQVQGAPCEDQRVWLLIRHPDDSPDTIAMMEGERTFNHRPVGRAKQLAAVEDVVQCRAEIRRGFGTDDRSLGHDAVGGRRILHIEHVPRLFRRLNQGDTAPDESDVLLRPLRPEVVSVNEGHVRSRLELEYREHGFVPPRVGSTNRKNPQMFGERLRKVVSLEQKSPQKTS